MPAEVLAVDPDQARRIELLVHQLEALPTLSGVALRLLEVASADHPRLEEIAALAACDPAIGSRLLRMCRCGGPSRHDHVTTVAGAVEHLGLDAVRSAVLSSPVLEILDGTESAGGERRDGPGTFCRRTFWRHSLAVALTCRELAAAPPLDERLDESEAFVAGLLHDLGDLVLHVLLPRSFDRAARLAEAAGVALDTACRQLLGVTPHTVGRRLAEHWRLPHIVGDVVWLHGQPSAALPDLPHRPLIELVTLADAIVRSRHVAPAGHGPRGEDLAELARPLGLRSDVVEAAAEHLAGALAAEAERLGIDLEPEPARLALALSRAGAALGRMHAAGERAAQRAAAQADALDAVTRFHDAAAPGGSIVAMLAKVAQSAQETLGGRFFAILYQGRCDDPWQLLQFAADGRLVASEVIDPPGGATALGDLADPMQVSVRVLGMLPWLSASLRHVDLAQVRLLPLRCGWGVNAVLIHAAPAERHEPRELAALSRTWASAIAAASHHAGARRMGERLAESHRALVETRGELSRREKMASLGEIAAGAAHEMNNPLTVISGRAQMLADRLTQSEHRTMARQIVEHSHRLSDMISTLRSFAEPVQPEVRATDLRALIAEQVERLRRDHEAVRVRIEVDPALPAVFLDPEQIGRALRELLKNAAESEGSRHLVAAVQIEELNDRLQVQVVDDGMGLSKHALAHAFDPFFSVKSAGRQPGLGLSHARRLVEAHGGHITLENGPARGAVATIWLPSWRGMEGAQERRVA